ncbi:MAG: hypothetical protein ACJAVM_001445 [Sulfitobacter sp.]|jgi:hypothetical protein
MCSTQEQKEDVMPDTQSKLDLSQTQLAVIEAALHTQSKILNVQASTGSRSARTRLNEVKSVLTQISQAKKPEAIKPCARIGEGWLGMSRIFG